MLKWIDWHNVAVWSGAMALCVGAVVAVVLGAQAVL